MTNEETINGLMNIDRELIRYGVYKSNPNCYKALNFAIECVEKQVPKKPVFDIGLNLIDDEIAIPYCSVCNSIIYETDAFCCDCGQAIDWSE